MTDSELDVVYDYLDMLMYRGQTNLIDDILLGLRIRLYFYNEYYNKGGSNYKPDIDELLGYLTASCPVKSKLFERPKLYKEVQRYLELTNDPEKDTLLQGLE